MPKFADGSINLQELFCQLAEMVVNAVMDAGDEGDMLGLWQQQERIASEDAQHLRGNTEPQNPQVQGRKLLPRRHPRVLPEDGQGTHSRRGRDVRDGHERQEGPKTGSRRTR